MGITLCQKVLNVLEGGPLTSVEIIAKLKLNPMSVTSACSKLKKRGKIRPMDLRRPFKYTLVKTKIKIPIPIIEKSENKIAGKYVIITHSEKVGIYYFEDSILFKKMFKKLQDDPDLALITAYRKLETILTPVLKKIKKQLTF